MVSRAVQFRFTLVLTWWTVDEDMFTYVMKSIIEELTEENLNQESPEEVETRGNQDFESDEEMTSETEETDDDSEPNNESVNNYLDSANMATICCQQ